jgi:type III restriction enzyme
MGAAKAPNWSRNESVNVEAAEQASGHAKTYQGKPWKYLLIPHDVIAENMTLEWLASQFEAR